MAVSLAALGYGTTFSVETAAGSNVYVELAEAVSLTPPNLQTDQVAVTHMQSPARTQEFIAGLTDLGSTEITFNYIPSSTTDDFILAWRLSGERRACRLDYVTADGGRLVDSFQAFVLGYAPGLPVADKMTATLTLKVAGAVERGAYADAAWALFDAMTIAAPAGRKALINSTILALQAAGVWDLLDVLYLIAAHDEQAGRLNWKSPGAFTALPESHGPGFVGDRGFAGNGVDQYLRTQWTPSLNAVHMTQNSASAWVWSLTNAANNSADIGDTGASAIRVTTRGVAGQLVSRINDNTGSTATVADSLGLYGGQRLDATNKKGWRNGIEVSATTVAAISLSATEQWICGANTGQYSAKRLALAAWGASLAGKELAFYTAVLPYMQSLGAA